MPPTYPPRARPNASVPVYDPIALLGASCSDLSTPLHHVTPEHDASDFVPAEHRQADAPYPEGHDDTDLQTDSVQQHDSRLHDAIPIRQASLAEVHSLAPARNPTSTEHFDMLPPASSIHDSWQALHDYAQSHASEHGYAFSINTTAKNRSRIKLACVCFGQPKNTHKLTDETRVRKNRVSYKTGCRMWIEGKKQEDGTWLLRVGEAQHNHAGRPIEGWAMQRKRTWGLISGRIGRGGVTAQEELARISSSGRLDDDDAETGNEAEDETSQPVPEASHSLERGGMVWKIVEQEMDRKAEPSHGRDRGVGRTVEILQARLPGIHIFKRDVYNIRAQIKRAKKTAGQQLGDQADNDDADVQVDAQADVQADIQKEAEHDETEDSEPQPSAASSTQVSDMAHVEPSLGVSGARNTTKDSISPHLALSAAQAEVEQLRRENAQLKSLLGEKTKEIKEQAIAITGLRTQLEYMTNMNSLVHLG